MRFSSLLIIIGIISVSFAILSGCKKQLKTAVPSPTLVPDHLSSLFINEKEYRVEVAQTTAQRQQGLSGREVIGSDGMLFVFSEPGQPGFWMIDMKIDLDFIWIRNGKVTQITKDVKKPEPNQSPSQLPKYFPHQEIDMMLEVEAGFVAREGIEVGDSIRVVTQ